MVDTLDRLTESNSIEEKNNERITNNIENENLFAYVGLIKTKANKWMKILQNNTKEIIFNEE